MGSVILMFPPILWFAVSLDGSISTTLVSLIALPKVKAEETDVYRRQTTIH